MRTVYSLEFFEWKHEFLSINLSKKWELEKKKNIIIFFALRATDISSKNRTYLWPTKKSPGMDPGNSALKIAMVSEHNVSQERSINQK
jgi:hypothetical protein